MKKTVIILLGMLLSVLQIHSQCDPRLSVKTPDDPAHFIKSFDAFMPEEKDSVLNYTLLLKKGVNYKIEIFETDDYRQGATYSLYEGDKLLAVNHSDKTGKSYPSYNFKCGNSMTYNMIVRKINTGKYCASWVIQEVKDSGEKHFELSVPDKPAEPDKTNFIIVETMPEFIAGKGVESFKDWINANLVYPKEAQDNKISGRVYINFVVDTDGSVTDVKVIRGVHPVLDKAALDLIKSSPKWEKAGKQRGQSVRVAFTFPITFELSSK
ncbi:MAG: energy transducer TonB [Bacteroidales bacterium]|nr:energy transducer TonB [Bacteroidales bacterium]